LLFISAAALWVVRSTGAAPPVPAAPKVLVSAEPEPASLPPPPSIGLSPAESIATMQLQPGYHLETVLAEPQVEEPVMIAFDGNGRMYVAEMRTYMKDADAAGEFAPHSRVSRHEDTDGDGIYDRHTVFADGLVLPRILLTLDDRVIIGETNTDDLYVYRDTNGDGVADEKKLWFKGEPRGGNMEHQPSGLIWALDNGIYATYYDYRLHFNTGTAVKESIPANGGQWGLTQDDWGKVWFVNAGGEMGPVHFQQPILYGKFEAGGEYGRDFKTVWPIDHIPDTQGGRNQLRDDNTLNHFTATCGQDIFRGDRLPADLRGDLLFAEPVGRLIRRAKITVKDGITQLNNAYDHAEFIRATDPLFRPVNLVTAPDGTLYIVDMYRGIIQESEWTKKGSYLRGQIDAYHLAHETGRGRIYRLTHDGFTPGPPPHMLDETPAQWVAHLSHPNGWWRDTAQKLLVLRHDLSVVPALEMLARTPATDPRPRLHALWTLDGLGALPPDLILAALADADPEIRRAGLRLAEPRLGPAAAAADPLLVAAQQRLHDPDPNVVIQAMLSLRRGGRDDAKPLIQAAAASSPSAGVYTINEQLWSEANNEDPFLLPVLGPAGLKSYRAGRAFYDSLCFACHGTDGRGAPATEGRTIAPPLAGSPRVLGDDNPAIAIVLHGLQGPVNQTDFGAPMISLSTYPDQQLADVLTYVRNSFGNRGAPVGAGDVAARRAADAGRAGPWTLAELRGKFPALQVAREKFHRRSAWKLTASEASAKGTTLEQAVDDDPETGYLTAASTPYPGQWFQVELPAVSTITAIDMEATASPEDFAPAYSVQISDDGRQWGGPVVSGVGEPDARINFNQPVTTKFVRITLTEKQGWQKWAINNLDFYGKEGK
jgi:glucose/arabinose dehydrogenase/mono/diheme cytochrome c family protein